LTRPKGQRRIEIIGFIKEEEVIEKILEHLGFLDVKARLGFKGKAPLFRI
jgi:hypothetical protein